MTNWQVPPCIGPPCAGGVGTPSSYTQAPGYTQHSIDGQSMFMAESGTNYSNITFVYSAGAQNAVTYYSGSFQIYIPDTSPFQSVGVDMYHFVGGIRYMFGTECDLAGLPSGVFWRIWDELHGNWILTSAPCTLTQGSFHTVVFKTHRVIGDLSCSGVACEYYDSFVVDGAELGPFPPQPSGTTTHSDASGIQFDLNSTSAGGTLNAIVDKLNYSSTIGSPITLNADNIYCPISGIPVWGVNDGPALLPTTCYNSSSANTPATGSVVNVLANNTTDLQAKLTAAVCGQKITLPAGSTYGQVTYPPLACPTSNYVWIQTSAVSSLPPEGTRTSPCYSGVTSLPGRPAFSCPGTPGTYAAQIKTTNSTPAIKFTSGASGVRMIGLELTRTSGTGLVQDLVGTGNVGSIDHLVFDRMWIHGDENQDETKRGISVSAASYIAVVDSYFTDIYCISTIGACTDAHDFSGGTNVTNGVIETGLKAVNNFFEAAGEPVLFGGGSANTTPSNIEIRLNTLFAPLIWNPSDPSYNGGVSGHPLYIKNSLELKNAQLVLVEGNQAQNMWGGFSQNGYAYLLTPLNQAGLCPTCMVTNVTFRYNTANTVGAFMQLGQLAGGSDLPGAQANHWSVHDNVGDNILYPTCFGCFTSSSTIQLRETVNPNSTQTLHDVLFDHNTIVYPTAIIGSPAALLGLSGPTIPSGAAMNNITFTNNLAWRAAGGTTNSIGGSVPANCSNTGSAGAVMINECWSPNTFGGNCFVNNGTGLTWPGSNVTSVASYALVFTGYNNGSHGNYLLSNNACKGQALDTLDPGANITMLNSILVGGSIIPVTSVLHISGTNITISGTNLVIK